MGIPGAANPLLLRRAAAAGDDAYQIEKSLRFNSADSAYLNNITSKGNTRTWTWSGWVKRGKLGADIGGLFATGGADSCGIIRFNNNDTLFFYNDSPSAQLQTTAVYRDTSAWYHIVVGFDSTQSLSTERLKFYVNGEQITSFGVIDYPDQNSETSINKAGSHDLGRIQQSVYFNGLMANVQFIDGLQLSPAAFGSFDSTGVWNPKTFALPAPNAGTTYSGGTVTGSNTNSGGGPAQAFDGSLTSAHWRTNNSEAQKLTFGSAITVSSSLNFYCKGDGNQPFSYWMDGTEYEVDPTAELGANTEGWVQRIGAGSFQAVEVSSNSGGNRSRLLGIEVDGGLLVDGQTDSATRNNPNNGTTWSDYLTPENNWYSGSYGATHGFDGSPDSGNAVATSGNLDTITFAPATPITVNSSVSIFQSNDNTQGTGPYEYKLDGVTKAITHDNTDKWLDIPEFKGKTISTSTPLTIERVTSGDNTITYFHGIKVDGHILIDDTYDNSFHLKFNDVTKNRYLGKDTLNGKIADATGGLPIYKTSDDYGDVKGSGTESDSNSANLLLALPLDATATTSLEATIHGSGSNRTLTNEAAQSFSTKGRFYGSSIDFGHNSCGLTVPASSDWDRGTGDLTIECWINKNTTSSNDYLLNSAENAFAFYFNTGGLYHGNFSSGGNNSEQEILDIADYPYNQWFHLSIVKASGSFKVYVNGALKKTTASNYTVGSNAVLQVGNNTAANNLYVDAYVQDLKIYSSAIRSANFTAPNRNDFTVNNLAHDTGPTAVSLASATGGKPIWVTTNEGDTKSSPEDAVDPDNDNEGTDIKSYIKWAIAGDGADGTTITHAETNHASDIYSSYSGLSGTPDIIGNPNWSTTTSRYYGSSLYWDGDDRIIFNLDTFGTNDFTIEFWLNHAGPSSDEGILGWSSSGQSFAISATTDGVEWKAKIGSSTSTIKASIDNGVWTHYAIVRDKGTYIKIYKNGVEQDSSTSDAGYNTNIAAASSSYLYTMGAVDWRANGGSLGSYLTGYLQDFRVYSTRKYKANFTVPVKSTVQDIDSLVDTPTNYTDDSDVVHGNYCTLNPLNATTALSNGNLEATMTNHPADYGRGTWLMTSGKWYFEWTVASGTPAGAFGGVSINQTGQGGDYGFHGNGYIYPSTSGPHGGLVVGDVIGIGTDASAGSVAFYKNGSLKYTHTGITTGQFIPYYGGTNGGTASIAFNFGQRPFKYTNAGTDRPAADYKALCTQNLDDTFSGADVNNPSKFFDTKTYTGTGADLDIKGLGFKPDLVWMKPRSAANDHVLVDAVRGVTKRLFSNLTNAESTAAESLKTFNSDGFTLGDHSSVNTSNVTHVAWNWDAGTSAGTVKSGATGQTITASNSWYNQTSGFEILKYSGTGSAGKIGHNLNAPPAFIIIKQTSDHSSTGNGDGNWLVGHDGIGAGSGRLILNGTYANETSSAAAHWNSTTPTNELFGLGTSGNVNGSGSTYAAYLWTAIPGYSAFGSYEGNGSTDGTFVYTGFRPRYILYKNADNSGRSWFVHDTERSPTNGGVIYITANQASTEGTNIGGDLDLLSNGFKWRTANNDQNNNGDTFIYACFAESPFKTARAR